MAPSATKTDPALEAKVENTEGTEQAPEESARPRRESVAARRERLRKEQLAQARTMAASFRHAKGCREEGTMPDEADSRVEFYPAIKPPTAERPTRVRMLTIHCIECGETESEADESEEV